MSGFKPKIVDTENIFQSLFLLLIVCGVLFSCNSSPTEQTTATQSEAKVDHKNCTQKIIAADHDAGEVRNHACEKQALSKTVIEYVETLKQFNFSDCPKKFELAFTRHGDAWMGILKVTDNYPELRGELHNLFKVLEESPDSLEFKSLTADIWSTWAEVEAAMK